MLVLTRKQNEKIRIGDSITITVLRMKGKAVRLGIEAPAEVGVMRGELVFDLETGDQTDKERPATKKEPRRDCGWPAQQESAGSAPLRSMLKNQEKACQRTEAF